MNKIAVLITCHNRREKTIACLKSLFQCQLPENYNFDVFLVDDGSTDGTSEAVKNEFPNVNIIQGNGQLFWNRGMRLAWETAAKEINYNYYLWLNDDTKIFKDALTMMLDGAKSLNNERIIVGAVCSELNGIVTYSGFNVKNKILSPNGNWQDCHYFNGNIVLIPSYVFNKVGFLDHQFRHALGDIDYGLRALKLGLANSLSPYFLGYCETHEADPVWCNISYPWYKRLKNLYTPLGNNTIEFFIFDQRHKGLLTAVFHFLTIHLRTFFPSLWTKKRKIATSIQQIST